MPDELEAALGAALADGTGPGITAALVGGDGTIRVAAAGLADVQARLAMTADTQLAMGSVSKSLTAGLILRLRDRGVVSLEDPLVRHLPEVAGFGDPFGAATTVSLRDVFRHLAGLPGEAPSPDPRTWDPAPVASVLAQPGAVTWAIPPRAAFKYSNLGYELLGEVAARAGGRSYAELVREELLEPLGMAATSLGPSSAAARGHAPASSTGDRAAAGPGPDGGAAGGWWSTAGDLARWVALQLAPEAGPAGWLPGTTREAHRPVVVTNDRLGAAYGLGWRVARRDDHVHVGHGGLTTGFEARVELDSEHGIGVVVLLNGIGPAEPTMRLTATLLALAGDGEPRAAERPAAPSAPPGPDPTGLAGRYREVGFETLVTIEPTIAGPWLRTDGDAGGPLVPTGDPDRYRIEHGRSAGELLTVLRDRDGAIDGINVAGYPMARLPD